MRKVGCNRKGEMATNTIVLLILGLVVLVALLYGFVTGWSDFKDRIEPTNVDEVVESCFNDCSMDQKFNFCSSVKTLRVNDEDFEVKTTCHVLSTVGEFKKYRIATCPKIKCDFSCDEIKVDGIAGSSSSAGSIYDVTAATETNTPCYIKG